MKSVSSAVSGVTLAGFVRGRHLNVYTRPERARPH
jgi:formate dehydrogenase assembly factor FdhD